MHSVSLGLTSLIVLGIALIACGDGGSSGPTDASGGLSGAPGSNGGTLAGGKGGTSGSSNGGSPGGAGSFNTGGAGPFNTGGAGAPNAGAAGSSNGGSASGMGGSAGTEVSGGAGNGGVAGSAAGSGGQCVPDYDCEPPPPTPTADPVADCVARVNQYRACACVPPLARWQEGEDCAHQRVAYDRAQDSPHAAFRDQICQPLSFDFGYTEAECTGSMNNCVRGFFREGPPLEPGQCDAVCWATHGNFINMTHERVDGVACGLDGNWVLLSFHAP